MPKVGNETPAALRTFQAHGVDIDHVEGDVQAKGTCPFCGAEKFFVNTNNGLWDCKVCGLSGNPITFVREVYKLSRSLPRPDYAELLASRKLLSADTLWEWGVTRSPFTQDWLVPGYDEGGKLCNLYRYVPISNGRRKMALLATPELKHGLHMPAQGLDSSKPDLVICEGPWDAMALWEVMKCAKANDDGSLSLTGSDISSLTARTNIIAAPGCAVFTDTWNRLASGKTVYLAYDNDHPRTNPQTNARIEPAGWAGMRRVANVLATAAEPPSAVHCLRWGPGESDHDPTLPSGYDVRDWLTTEPSIQGRIHRLDELWRKVQVIPDDWVGGRSKETAASGGLQLLTVPCQEWAEVRHVWQLAFKWTDGLDRGLACCLAVVLSTETIGEQLWIKLMGPPSSGKTSIAEALAVARQYVYSRSTIRGIHSGYKNDKEGSEDMSLIPKIKNKTLVIKDGDTLLQAPNRDQILAEMRDFFDGVSRTHYRHGMARDYEGIRATFILCGTGGLRALDASELGARFIDVVIMMGIDTDLEREINRRVAHRALRNVSVIANGDPTTRQDPAMTRAKQLTGGYVEYLRQNAQQLLSRVKMADSQVESVIGMGEFVAYLRARPSKKQDEVVEREFSSRLVEQFIRLATCLAAATGTFDLAAGGAAAQQVIRRIAQCALDTAHGRTMEIVELMYREGDRGVLPESMAIWTHQPPKDCERYMRFLRRIKALEVYTPPKEHGVQPARRWRLTARLRDLYEEVTTLAQAPV